MLVRFYFLGNNIQPYSKYWVSKKLFFSKDYERKIYKLNTWVRHEYSTRNSKLNLSKITVLKYLDKYDDDDDD